MHMFSSTAPWQADLEKVTNQVRFPHFKMLCLLLKELETSFAHFMETHGEYGSGVQLAGQHFEKVEIMY